MLKPGHVYKRFVIASGKRVTLRVLQQEDLDGLLFFINRLVGEKRRDRKSTLYTGFDRKFTRAEEAEYLARSLEAIKQGKKINMVAEVAGKIIANGGVTRGRYKDTRHHGELGLTMIHEYRGQGIGHEMIEALVRESRRAGLRSLEVEFLANNEMARRAYEKAGFKKAGLIPNKIYRNGKYFDGLIIARKL